MRRHVFWMVFLGAMVLAQDVWAGPWTKGQGEYYAKVSELWFSSDTFIAPDGTRVQGAAEFTSFSSALYAEFGVLDGLHVQAFIPYVWATNRFEARETTYGNLGLGDVIVAAQWTPVKLPLPWAIRLDAKIPGYDVGGIEGPQATSFPVFGDGQLDVTTWLSIGGSLHPLPVYVLGEVGYRARTEIFNGAGNDREFLDSIAFSAQTGWAPVEGVWTVLNVNGVVPLGDDTVTQGFLTVGPGLAVNVWRGLSIEATFDAMLWGRNNSPGPGVSLGLSYKGSLVEQE